MEKSGISSKNCNKKIKKKRDFKKTIKNLILNYKDFIDWSPTPILDIEILISNIINKEKIFLLTHPNYELNEKEYSKFLQFIKRRKNYEPIAYIIGEKEFFGYKYKVNKDVLIPRPETELLVEIALRKIYENQYRKIVEVGTGSGCIINTIAKELSKEKQDLELYATDISPKAIRIAKENHQIISPKYQINFIISNLLDNLELTNIDLLIANLPYIPLNKYKNLDKNVLEYEPEKALLGGETGKEIIVQLLKNVQNQLNKKFTILLEINYNQAKSLSKIIKEIYPNSKIGIIKDYANLDRFIIIENN